jgi:hypothetical protein
MCMRLVQTYFVASEFQKEKLLIGLPIVCFVIEWFCSLWMLFGLFWPISPFFILYDNNIVLCDCTPATSLKNGLIDNLIIYTATVYPMLFYFIAYAKVQLVCRKNKVLLKVRFALKTIGWFYVDFIVLCHKDPLIFSLKTTISTKTLLLLEPLCPGTSESSF